MSHTATVEVEFRLPQQLDCLEKACKRAGAEFLGQGKHRLFGGVEEGVGVKPTGWRFPIVIQEGGNAKLDDYGGHWGDMKTFDKLKQAYSVEVAKKAARKQGLRVRETACKDGSIKLVCMGG